MRIEVVNMSAGKGMHESLYRVEVDGVQFETGVAFKALPEVIDRIYSSREEEMADQLITVAADLKVRAQALRDSAAELDLRAENIMDIYRKVWEGRLK